MGFCRRQRKIYRQILVFAKTLVDRGWQRGHQELMFEYDLDASASDFVRQLESGGKGIVTAASHIGGWELAMTFFARVPTEKKMLAVMHGIRGQYGHDSAGLPGKTETIYFNLG